MIAETSPQLIIASHNAGKIKEFQQVLGTHWRVQPQADFGVTEAEETGSTFVENALIKARHACSLTGHAALADDSGLVVPALDGAPGLRSARYSGSSYEDNNTLLLNNMAALQGASRQAFYIAVVVLLRDAQDPTPLIAEGRWHGRIADAIYHMIYDMVTTRPRDINKQLNTTKPSRCSKNNWLRHSVSPW